MIKSKYKKSVNLKGTPMLFDHTPWCSVVKELLDDTFRQQTPMSVLFSTPEATPHHCHSLMWQINPVASAGCANRPHPRGVGSFKLHLRRLKRLLVSWSGNLKGREIFCLLPWGFIHDLPDIEFRKQTPMPVLLFHIFAATPTQQQPSAAESIQ